ncbi:hypothetical protein [Halegenticoccus tardaugens]|uniref:hypothetical protein n=1 Tax=Halegenticoccus tardaugens TaxID=2071624 RepID=UPI00100BFC4B|nr:hypothetical protein [Halegenticoccus tardaugens]
MFWKLISALIGSRWRAFCGLSQDRFLAVATTALDDLGYRYDLEETSTTRGERTMLGAAERGHRFAVSDPVSFDVTVITATTDPVADLVMSVFVTEEQQSDITSDLCVVTLSPVTAATREEIARFVTAVIGASETPPWKLTHHIRFRLAVLLRLKVRLLWKYWLHASN